MEFYKPNGSFSYCTQSIFCPKKLLGSLFVSCAPVLLARMQRQDPPSKNILYCLNGANTCHFGLKGSFPCYIDQIVEVTAEPQQPFFHKLASQAQGANKGVFFWESDDIASFPWPWIPCPSLFSLPFTVGT